MRGTYNLISEKIDLHGSLKTEAEVSKTTHGFKALILKMLDPFFKNKPNGYVAPVKITGTYDHPSFGLDLGDRDNDQKQSAKVHTSRLRVQTTSVWAEGPRTLLGFFGTHRDLPPALCVMLDG
jgi:hypothetical protein